MANPKDWQLPPRHIATHSNIDHGVLWNNAVLQYEQRLFGQVAMAQFHPTGRNLAIVAANQWLLLRLPPTEGAVWNEQNARTSHSMRYRSDGRLVVQSVERRVVVKAVDSAFERQLCGHTRDVRDAAFVTNQRVASCSDDGTVRLWDMVGEVELATTEGAHGAHVDYVRRLVVADESTIISGGYDHRVCLWDVRSGFGAPACEWRVDAAIEDLIVVPRSSGASWIVAAAGDVVSIFDIRGGSGGDDEAAREGDAPRQALQTIATHTKTVTSLAYCESHDVLITGSVDKRVKFTSLAAGTEFTTVATRTVDAPVTAVAVHPEATSIAIGTALGAVQLLRLEPPSDTQNILGGASLSKAEKVAKLFEERRGRVRRALVSFKYGRALRIALYARNDDVVLSTLEELLRRGALRVALSGHDDRTIVQLLRFAVHHVDAPLHTSVCIAVIDAICEIYGAWASKSAFFHGELLRAHQRVGRAVASLEVMQRTIGLMELVDLMGGPL